MTLPEWVNWIYFAAILTVVLVDSLADRNIIADERENLIRLKSFTAGYWATMTVLGAFFILHRLHVPIAENFELLMFAVLTSCNITFTAAKIYYRRAL